MLDADGRGTFSAVLPASPLSYEGELIQIRWTVRVRASSPIWADLLAEEAFRLGHVVAVVEGAWRDPGAPACRPFPSMGAGHASRPESLARARPLGLATKTLGASQAKFFLAAISVLMLPAPSGS